MADNTYLQVNEELVIVKVDSDTEAEFKCENAQEDASFKRKFKIQPRVD
jgi:hypothetical protein